MTGLEDIKDENFKGWSGEGFQSLTFEEIFQSKTGQRDIFQSLTFGRDFNQRLDNVTLTAGFQMRNLKDELEKGSFILGTGNF